MPCEESEGWLSTEKDMSDLKILAERMASEDAVKRAKRRKQNNFDDWDWCSLRLH